MTRRHIPSMRYDIRQMLHVRTWCYESLKSTASEELVSKATKQLLIDVIVQVCEGTTGIQCLHA